MAGRKSQFEEMKVSKNKVENLKKQSRWGGKRSNAGRDKGSKNKATIEKQIVEEALKQRILRSTENLLNSQMNLASGCSFLYCIHTDVDKKNGKRTKQKPRLVTSQSEIESYLAGELEDEENDYYFITTEKPDNKALDSLFDRVFGKAKNSLDITSDGQALGVVVLPQKDVNTLETNNKAE